MTIRYTDYFNKVYGGWLGKCIGGTIGARMENNKELMDFTAENVFPEAVPPNDDLDLQLLWLQVLERQGARLSSEDLADAWLRHCWYPFNEYGYFVKNYRLGVLPPASGTFNNGYFRHSMGCPIRAEIWAFIAPGDPDRAAEYAQLDGQLDHDGEAVYGERFIAALEAAAFVESDLERLIEIGLGYVPRDSALARSLALVTEQHAKGATWQQARRQLLNRFGTPDASHSVQNIALTVLALLYGGGDFAETMLIAVNSGYDTDCTAATAGAILGQIAGADGLPEDWIERMGPDYVIGIDVQRRTTSIRDLAEDTCRAGLSLRRDGLLAAEIVGVPEGIEPSLPVARKPEETEVAVEYVGEPSIAFDAPAEVRIGVVHRGDASIQGQLRIMTPGGIVASVSLLELRLEPGERVVTTIRFRVADSCDRLPLENPVQLLWMPENRPAVKRSFGLAGARRFEAFGPFWDTYDSSVHTDNPYRNRTPGGRYNFNNFVRVDKSYLDEAEIGALGTGEEATIFDAAEDKLPLDELFPHVGPSCVYVRHRFESPSEREAMLVVGNNDGFVCWLNGERTASSDEVAMWTPYNHRIGVKLRQGVNEIVFKLVRRDRHFDFSFNFQGDAAGFTAQGNFLSNPEAWQRQLKFHWFTDFTSLR